VKTLSYKPCKDIYERFYDTYIVHLSTGLRVDDLLNLSATNVIIDYSLGDILSRKRAHIKLFMGKTNKPLIIPLNKMCYDVMKKYKIPINKMSFNDMNNQSYNTFLKMMCKDLKIDTLVRKTTYRGKQPIIIEKPLHELVSSHTIRKTFISLALKQNNPTKVMDVSGHSSYSSFKRYINLDMGDKSDVVDTLNNVYTDIQKEKKKK
jgi:integrase